MLFSVMFNKTILNRYVCHLFFGDGEDNQIDCIIDTACSTTLVPLAFAKRHGKPLRHTASVTVAGHKYKATLYQFDNVRLGNWLMPKMVAFAAAYKGNIEESVLLGLNVLNNLEITLTRCGRELFFKYNPWILVKDKPFPCTMFFKDKGSHPVYPNDLLVEFDN